MSRSTIVPVLLLFFGCFVGCRKEPLPVADASADDASSSDAAMKTYGEEDDPPEPPEPPDTTPAKRGCDPGCASGEKCVGISCVPANVGLTMTREHTCVLDRSGRVQCWGANKNGEVGDGSRAVRNRPVDVTGLSDATQIVARDGATCARRRTGDVVCWGRALDQKAEHLVPTPVDGLRGAVDIAFGRDFLCGAMPSGSIACLPEPRSPVRVGVPVDDATAIAATGNELCALRRNHVVTCWVKDRYLADGGTHDERVPRDGATDVVALTSSGEAICAIAATGKAKCWSDAGIALVDGGIRPSSVIGMHDFARLGPVSSLSFLGWGDDEDCAIRADGETVCWAPPFISKRRPPDGGLRRPLSLTTKVIAAPPAVLIASSKRPTAHCILTRTGEVRCWGEAAGARVGSVRNPDQATPLAIDGVRGVRDVTASDFSACARLSNGAISCWGAGKTPHVVKAEAIDRLLSGLCASVKGALTCFDQPFENPLPDSGLRDIVELAPAGGGSHILSYWARSASGQVSEVAWGRSNDGQRKWTLTYARPTEIKNARALFAAGDVNCVREANTPATSLRCWPRLSEFPPKLTAITVPAGFEQLQLQGNRFNASYEGCGVSGGRVGCFDSKLEVKWQKIDGVQRYAQSPHGLSCALTNGGALHCWGTSDDDLTGHGTAGVKEPRVVPGLERGVVGFAFAQESWNSEDAVYAWTSDGRLLAWGHNGRDDERMGQLGWVAPSVIKTPQKVER